MSHRWRTMFSNLSRLILLTVAAGLMACMFWLTGCSDAPDSPATPGSQSLSPSENGLVSTSFPLIDESQTDSQSYIDRQVLVVLDDDTEKSIGAEFFASFDATVLRSRPLQWGTLHCLEISDSTTVPDMVGRFENEPGVRIVQPNYKRYFDESAYTPNDPMWEWDGDTDDDPRTNVFEMWGPAKLGASIVWNDSKGDGDIVVAIIDTGIRYDHEDLNANIWHNTDEIDGNGIDDDNNGYIDDWWGWNCYQMNNDPYDDGAYAYYHGTGCAGVVAATQDNNVGLSGIAPGIKLMAVKVLFANNYTSDETIMEALNYVAVNNADIVSMSFGGYDVAPGFHEAIQSTWDNGNGPLLIASAGNANNQVLHYPASYDEVIAVAATVPFSYTDDPVDERRIQRGWAGWWWGSTYGDWISISGFGEKYMTTRGLANDTYWDGVNYWFFNGTSCACPTAAGTAALIKTFHPDETNQWYWDRLEETADDLETPGFDIETGHGRINALRAVYGSDRYSDYEDADGFLPLMNIPDYPEPELFDSIHDRPDSPHHDTQDLFLLVPEYDGELTIDLDIFTWGENLDLALYSDKAMTNLIDQAVIVNHADSSFENITLMVDGGTDYYLKVYSPAEGNSTTFGLDINYDYNEVTITGDPINPPTANSGQVDLQFLRLNFDIKFDATLDRLNINTYSDSLETNWGMFKLYRDLNFNGFLDTGDELVDSEPVLNGNTAAFEDLDLYWTSAATMRLFVTADLSTDHPDESEIYISLNSASDITLEETVIINDSNFPIQSGAITIEQ